MSRLQFQRRVPYERAGVFDIVADVERYPEFIPGCRSARIVERDGDRLLVEQEMGVGAWSWRFRTRATLSRPGRIEITTREAPFSHLDQVWRFEDLATGGTRVLLDVDYRLRNPLLRGLVSSLFAEGFRRTVAAFERRLHQRLEPRGERR
ncbi:MAG: type II toxin-antitoxin system RatA family toxin [Halofilum sp. (in: g-proteobacteria)]|nr:type II toxin-antitoxin system RatA family toxin [Halofilum sp. (in: g-proteobacteria)]